MTYDPDIEIFLEISNAYMHAEDFDPEWSVAAIHRLKQEPRKEAFRRGFAKACLGGVTAKEYEKATAWDFESDEAFRAHLAHYWNLFYPDSKPADWASPSSSFSSLEGYRGWRNEEGDTVYYTVERGDGAAVLRVTELKLVDRTLHITYELASPSMYDGFARQCRWVRVRPDAPLRVSQRRICAARVLGRHPFSTAPSRGRKLLFSSSATARITCSAVS